MEIRRVLGATTFRRAYRMVEAGLFMLFAVGFLGGILALAFAILEYGKRNGY